MKTIRVPEDKTIFAVSQENVSVLLDALHDSLIRANKTHDAAVRKLRKAQTHDNIEAEKTTMEWLHMLRELEREIHQHPTP